MKKKISNVMPKKSNQMPFCFSFHNISFSLTLYYTNLNVVSLFFPLWLTVLCVCVKSLHLLFLVNLIFKLLSMTYYIRTPCYFSSVLTFSE